MWNPSLLLHHQEPQEDEPWELRPFPEVTGNIAWPPRSYTCTFCTRHFRSAQALGGHMNIHRHDRARLRCQSHHHLPNPSATVMANACDDNNYNLATPPTLLSTIYPVRNNFFSPFEAAPPGISHRHHHRGRYYERLGEPFSSSVDYAHYLGSGSKEESSSAVDKLEELDLELRL